MREAPITVCALSLGAICVAAMPGAAEAGDGRSWDGLNDRHHGHLVERRHWGGGIRHLRGDKCRVYLRKAERTGKSFWWKKYRWCVGRRRY